MTAITRLIIRVTDRSHGAGGRSIRRPMPPVSRRRVLGTLGASLAAPALLRAKGGKRLPIAFSTLGCPAWNWKTVLDQADRLGYAAIELRGIAGDRKSTRLNSSHVKISYAVF